MLSKIAAAVLGAAAAIAAVAQPMENASTNPTTAPPSTTSAAASTTAAGMTSAAMSAAPSGSGSFAPMTAPMIRAGFEDSAFLLDLTKATQVPGEGRLLEFGDQQSFPVLAILDTQMALARVTLDDGATNPTHVHPRATEVLYLVSGKMEVFIGKELGNEMIKNTLEAGQGTVFPGGLAHGQKCVEGSGGCVFVSMFNNADPGAFGVTI
jgi:quercetin dioxygenase-like cupin family protein